MRKIEEARDAGLVLIDALGYKPWPAQEGVFNSEERFVLVTGGEQSGKALDVETPIATPDGWTTMGVVRVGDEVFGDDGKPVRVEWVSGVQELASYLVSFDDGSAIIASGEHQWLARNYSARKHGFSAKVWTTEEMLAGGLIRLAPMNRRPFANWSIANPKPLDCPEADLPLDPYVFGAWLGDGNSDNASITTADDEVLVQLAWAGVDVRPQAGRLRYGMGGMPREGGRDTAETKAASLNHALRELGVLSNKHIPQAYLRASEEQRMALLRGLMDTDGYVDKRGRTEFCNTNKELIQGFVELVASLGFSYRVREKRATLYGKDCGPVWTVLFQTRMSVFSLSRKHHRQKPQLFSSRSENIYIVGIESVGIKSVRCLGVGNESHLYLAGRGMVPTHNSQVSVMRLIRKLPETDGAGLYWLVGRNYGATEREYGYLVEALGTLGLLKEFTKRVDPGVIELVDGTIIKTKSADDPRTLMAEGPDGIVICEAGQVDLETYNRCSGRTAPKRGWLFAAGCLTGDTVIATDEGMLRIGEVVGDVTHSVDVGIHGLGGAERATLAWSNGVQPIKRVKLTKGFEIAGTLDHRVVARLPDGSVSWVSLGDLTPKHLVAIRYGMELWGPLEWSDEEAYLAGVYIAEGSWEANEIPLQARMVLAGVGRHAESGIGQGRPGIPRKAQRTRDRITFTLGPTDGAIKGILAGLGYVQAGYHWRLTDNKLAGRFREMGIDPLWKAHTKRVPQGIMRARGEYVAGFLRGLFDGDGTVNVSKSGGRGVRLDTASIGLAKDVQLLLLNLGVVSSITKRVNRLAGKSFTCYGVHVSDPTAFVAKVGFRLLDKMERAKSLKPPRFLRNQANAGASFLGHLVVWCRPTGAVDDSADTYDLHVPGSHAYWANGLVVHNTMEGSLGWYPGLAQAWRYGTSKGERSYVLPTWGNLTLYPGGRQDPEILRLEASASDDWFMERMAGVPSPPRGAVFGQEFRPHLHVREIEWDDTLPVTLWVDPGYAGAHAVEVVQVKHDVVYVVDEIYERGLVTEQIIEIAQSRPWWRSSMMEPGVIDVAGYQHQAMAAPVEVWLEKAGYSLSGSRVLINDGNERLKTFLKPHPVTGEPRIIFSPKCRGVLSELGAVPNPIDGSTSVYRWKVDSQGNVVGSTPEQKNNHGLSAIAYGLVARFGYTSVTGGDRNRIHVSYIQPKRKEMARW